MLHRRRLRLKPMMGQLPTALRLPLVVADYWRGSTHSELALMVAATKRENGASLLPEWTTNPLGLSCRPASSSMCTEQATLIINSCYHEHPESEQISSFTFS